MYSNEIFCQNLGRLHISMIYFINVVSVYSIEVTEQIVNPIIVFAAKIMVLKN